MTPQHALPSYLNDSIQLLMMIPHSDPLHEEGEMKEEEEEDEGDDGMKDDDEMRMK